MKDDDTKELPDAAPEFNPKIESPGPLGIVGGIRGVKAPFAQDKPRHPSVGCTSTLAQPGGVVSPGQRIVNLSSTLVGRTAVVLGTVQGLSSRVCGARPEPSEPTTKAPPANGLLDKLVNDLATAVGRVEEIQTEVNRLSEALSFDLSL